MDSKNKVQELIDKRWSPRAFSDKKVDLDVLERVFEAARRAPSTSNEQPWRFIVGIEKNSSWEKIYSCLDDFNQLWAKFPPVLCLVVAKSVFEKSGNTNGHSFYDCGQAVAYLTMQATYEGLFVHQMAGFNPAKASEVFNIPDGYEPITVFALGYIGDPQILPERMQKNEYFKVIRKELLEIVFAEWGTPIKF